MSSYSEAIIFEFTVYNEVGAARKATVSGNGPGQDSEAYCIHHGRQSEAREGFA